MPAICPTILTTAQSTVPEATTPDKASHFTTVIADSFEAVEHLRLDWTRLRNGCSLTTPNTDQDRYVATIRGLRGRARAYVAMFHAGAEPRALIVGREQVRSAKIRFGYLQLPGISLRSLDIVYGGLISDESPQAIRAVVDHLSKLIDTGRFDQIMINHVPLHSPIAIALLADRALARRAAVDSVDPHWRFALIPGSYEQTIDRFSRKHRYNMRRADRLLVDRFAGDVSLRRFESLDDVEELMAGAAQITARTYQGALAASPADAVMHRNLMRLEADQGRLRSYWLECDGQPIAFQLGVVYGDVYNLLSTAFLPEYAALSPGQVLLVRVIQDLCEARIGSIDYGFGDAPYKRMYGTESWDEATVYLYAKNVRASTARVVERVAIGLRRRASAAAARGGLVAHLKKRWRSRLAGGTR